MADVISNRGTILVLGAPIWKKDMITDSQPYNDTKGEDLGWENSPPPTLENRGWVSEGGKERKKERGRKRKKGKEGKRKEKKRKREREEKGK